MADDKASENWFETGPAWAGYDSKDPSYLSSDGDYHILIPPPTLHLSHRYHDDEPVVGAPYEVEFENGQVLKGELDENGEADLDQLPAKPVKVRYGADARPYEQADQESNPDFQESFNESDADALVDKSLDEYLGGT